jgi:hypothetical protein
MTKPHDANDPIEDRDHIENAMALADRLLETIDATDDLSRREVLAALAMLIPDVLARIECPHCRQLSAKNLKSVLPGLIEQALTRAAKHHKQEMLSHVH